MLSLLDGPPPSPQPLPPPLPSCCCARATASRLCLFDGRSLPPLLPSPWLP